MPSWPPSRVRLSPFLARTYLVSTLFVLAHPAAYCLSQQFIFHTCNPTLTARRLNTFTQVNIMGAWHSICNEHIYSLQHFFLNHLFTYVQDGWPRTFMSGTISALFRFRAAWSLVQNSSSVVVFLDPYHVGIGLGAWLGLLYVHAWLTVWHLELLLLPLETRKNNTVQ